MKRKKAKAVKKSFIIIKPCPIVDHYLLTSISI